MGFPSEPPQYPWKKNFEKYAEYLKAYACIYNLECSTKTLQLPLQASTPARSEEVVKISPITSVTTQRSSSSNAPTHDVSPETARIQQLKIEILEANLAAIRESTRLKLAREQKQATGRTEKVKEFVYSKATGDPGKKDFVPERIVQERETTIHHAHTESREMVGSFHPGTNTPGRPPKPPDQRLPRHPYAPPPAQPKRLPNEHRGPYQND